MPHKCKSKLALTILLSLATSLFFVGAGWMAHRHPGQTGSLFPETAHLAGSNKGPAQLEPLKRKVELLIQERLQSAEVKHVSIYFHDLAGGPSFGIDENFRFAPASLMKVPVMIAYLKAAETDPQLLEDRISYDRLLNFNDRQGIQPHLRLQAGSSYTVDELLHRMIAFSDNNALALLMSRVDKNLLDKVLRDLKIDFQPTADGGLVSMKSYSAFFDALYSAAYLNREMSARALHYLTDEDFRTGIIAGVPPGTPVAGKFGEWARGRHSELRQLQEFGIIYYPNNPYLLGIEVEGGDVERLSKAIRDISQLVYNEFDAAHHRST